MASVLPAQERLDALDNLIDTKVGRDVARYAVEGMSLDRITLTELMTWRSTLKAEIDAGKGIAKTLMSVVRL